MSANGTRHGLVEALDQLAALGGGSVSPDDARAEGAAFAAAIAESAPGAPADWAAQLGRTVGDFFDAAVSARKWRAAPTAGLTALVASADAGAAGYAKALTEVAAAACDLGEPTLRVVGNASVAAAAQLEAAQVQPGPGLAPSGPGTVRAPSPGRDPRSSRSSPRYRSSRWRSCSPSSTN